MSSAEETQRLHKGDDELCVKGPHLHKRDDELWAKKER